MAWEEYFYGIKTFRESLPDVSNIPKIPESIYELINPGGEEKANNIEYMILIHHEKIKTLVQLGTFELGDELI